VRPDARFVFAITETVRTSTHTEPPYSVCVTQKGDPRSKLSLDKALRLTQIKEKGSIERLPNLSELCYVRSVCISR